MKRIKSPTTEYLEDTIINPYREVFGVTALPADKQIWSTGVPGELDCFTEAKFAKSEQYHLVSKGDLCQTMIEAKVIAKTFNPGVVHYHSRLNPPNGSIITARILDLLLPYESVLFVASFVVTGKGKEYSNDEVNEEFSRHAQVIRAVRAGWTFYGNVQSVYTYQAGPGRPWMAAIIMVNKATIRLVNHY